MKKLLLFLFITTFTIVGIPAILLGVVYDGSTIEEMPVHLYTEDGDGLNALYSELHESIIAVRTNQREDFELNIHQDIMNAVIFDSIRGSGEEEGVNPDYLPLEGCVGAACYIMETPIVIGGTTAHAKVLGFWVTFDENAMVGIMPVEIQFDDGFTFKTSIKLNLTMEDDLQAQEYRVGFDGVKLGGLPLSKGLFSRILGIVDSATAFDREAYADTMPMGTLNLETFTYTVQKSEIGDFLTENGDPMMALSAEVLNVVFDNNLMQFKLIEETFQFMLRMSLLRNSNAMDIPEELHVMRGDDGFDPDGFDPEQHMINRFESFVFNMALTGNTSIKIKESTFNKIIYHEMNGFEDARFEYEYENDQGQIETIVIGLDAIWVEFREDDTTGDITIYLKGLFNIEGIKSLLEIRAEDITPATAEPGHYLYEIEEITIGKEAGKEQHLSITDLESFKQALMTLDDFPFGHIDVDGNLVINTEALTDMMSEGTQEGAILIDYAEIVDRGIRVHLIGTGELQSILDTFTDGINTIFQDPNLLTELSNSLNTDDEGPEKDTYDQVEYIQDQLNDPDGEITEDDIETLFESYEEMDPESQDAFMETIEGLLDPDDLAAFEDAFTD